MQYMNVCIYIWDIIYNVHPHTYRHMCSWDQLQTGPYRRSSSKEISYKIDNFIGLPDIFRCPGRDEQVNLINRRSLSSQGVLEHGCGADVGLGFGNVMAFFTVQCWESSDKAASCTMKNPAFVLHHNSALREVHRYMMKYNKIWRLFVWHMLCELSYEYIIP